jgi:outer membrane receptor protein involved in Fe transport
MRSMDYYVPRKLWQAGTLLLCLMAAPVIAAPDLAQETPAIEALDAKPATPHEEFPSHPADQPASNPAETSQPDADRDLNALSIEELMDIDVQTVISASRYRQKVSEAPSSITIVTSEDISKYGYRTLADILRSVRGFTTTYDRNYTYVNVRGFGKLGDYNTRILLLVDGHRINDAIHDAASVGTEFILDVDLIERVEVTRGPGSSLYGSNAFFGVVNIVTRGARDIGGGELSAEAGSADTYKGRLSYGVAGEGSREVLASLAGFSSGGERLYFREYDPAYPFADPRAANNGFADEGDYDRSRSGYAKFELGGLRLAGAYIQRTKGIPTASYGTDFNNTGNRTVDDRGYLDLQYSTRTDRGVEYTARLYFDHYRHEGDYLYSGTVNKDLAVSSFYGGDARVTAQFLDAHRVIIGTEYEARGRQDQSNADEGVPSAVYLDDHRSSRIWAIYIQDEITLSPRFLLYAGIRHDHVSTFGGSNNPRLSAVITPIEHGTLKLLYGKAFRAPTVYELYYEAPPSFLSNPALQPETIETYELVYEHDLGNGLSASLGRYSYSIRNLISQTYDAGTGTTSFQNQELAQATGTELEVRQAGPGVNWTASYAFQKAKDPNTGEPLANSPEHLAKLNVMVPLVRNRLWAGLEEQYTGSRHTEAGQRTDGFAVTNLTLLGRNAKRTVELSLSVYNLLDRRYDDPVSSDLIPLDTVQQDGRAMRLKITYAF